MEVIKKNKRGRKIKEDTLTINTFFMHQENYDALSEANKRIGQKYIDSIANGSKPKSPATVKYNAWILRFMFENIENDLDNLTVDDIDYLIAAMNQWKTKKGKPVTNNTKRQYYIGIKRFLFWYAKRYRKADYRDLAELIELPEKEKGKRACDMLIDSEVEAMIKHVKAPRNKAIIATLAESGCRIGELLACKVGDVTFNDRGCDLNIRISKTEPRTIPLGEAAYYLQQYLSNHPLWSDKEAPLWITLDEGEIRAVSYSAVREMIQKAARELDITKFKRIHPHLFRHTAATSLSKTFNEFEFRKFMGWSPTSTTPSTYVHLDDSDIKYAVYAKRFGLVELVKDEKTGKILGRCPKCGTVMPAIEVKCPACKFIVNENLRDKVEKQEQLIAESLANFDKNTILSLYNMIGSLMKKSQ